MLWTTAAVAQLLHFSTLSSFAKTNGTYPCVNAAARNRQELLRR